MKLFSPTTFLGLCLASGNFLSEALQVTFYENDFENPRLTPLVASPCKNLDMTSINTMYGTPEHQFGQQNTVETVTIDHCWDEPFCNTRYVNSQGIGGKYAIGMLRDHEDDQLWLDFTVGSEFTFFNVDLDISAIDVNGCGGPFSPPGSQLPPVFHIELFDLNAGALLETKEIRGRAGAPNQWTYLWSHHQVSFNKGALTNLRIRINAIPGSSGYAVFDNLRIWGSDEEPTGMNGGAMDDPHIKTWDGKWYDYMGECDLVLIHAPNFDANVAMDINIRTKIRYLYSYIESAAIKIGEETLEVSSFGEYFLNGVSYADKSDMTISGFPIAYSQPTANTHVFEIQLGEGEKVILKSFKDMVSVKVDAAGSKRFQGSLGMMGSFDDNGTLVARNGTTVMNDDPNALAAEWQVRDYEEVLFQTGRSPQYPQSCILPDTKTMDGRARRLGESVARKTAEKACAKWSADTKEACIFDVMATGDLALAAEEARTF